MELSRRRDIALPAHRHLVHRGASSCFLLFSLSLLGGCGEDSNLESPLAAPTTAPTTPGSGPSPDSSGLPDSPLPTDGMPQPTVEPGGMEPPSPATTSDAPDNLPPPDDDPDESTPLPESCNQPQPGRAPLRRLTRFEYNNSVAALLGDTTQPANSLPSELLGNGFGNDADEQPTSSFLVEQYGTIAAGVASRLDLAQLSPSCVDATSSEAEQACLSTVLEDFARRAYRHPLDEGERSDLLALQQSVRELTNFEDSVRALVETVLQSPDFLYRLEWGEQDPENPTLRRPSGHEMAARLSYLFWGSLPDEELELAAANGGLVTADDVRAQAQRMLNDERARPVIRHFFDHFLPLNTLTDLARDPEQFPTFSPTIGGLMREETHRFLQYEIFEGPGDWPSVLTAPYTFLNAPLADFYGIEGVVGDEFRLVELDTSRRLGLLTQGAIQAGTTISNFTNPVRRGVFLLRSMMCVELPSPPEEFEDQVMPPDPYSGATGRERYSKHSENDDCAVCHKIMDPPGFALENYDAVGLWRDQENGVTIDASGDLDLLGGEFSGPIEMARMIADSPRAQDCFAGNWMTYAYGRTLESEDECTSLGVENAFAASGYDVQALLLAITQTDAFLYLPNEEAVQ